MLSNAFSASFLPSAVFLCMVKHLTSFKLAIKVDRIFAADQYVFKFLMMGRGPETCQIM